VTRLEIDQEAVAELMAAGDWYQAHARVGVAARFGEAIEKVFEEISETPDTFSLLETWRDVAVRRAIVRGFPYQIVYGRLRETIRVFAVAHLHRKPGYWRERLRQRDP
jgi:plasmid stabilization system protein ParE